MATVFIPQLLRDLSGGANRVPAEGSTLREVLASLESIHPGICARILDEAGVRPEVFLAVGSTESFSLDDSVKPDDEVHILPAIAGG